jgi:hypothetical protein
MNERRHRAAQIVKGPQLMSVVCPKTDILSRHRPESSGPSQGRSLKFVLS